MDYTATLIFAGIALVAYQPSASSLARTADAQQVASSETASSEFGWFIPDEPGWPRLGERLASRAVVDEHRRSTSLLVSGMPGRPAGVRVDALRVDILIDCRDRSHIVVDRTWLAQDEKEVGSLPPAIQFSFGPLSAVVSEVCDDARHTDRETFDSVADYARQAAEQGPSAIVTPQVER
jgi:hypothetical protein